MTTVKPQRSSEAGPADTLARVHRGGLSECPSPRPQNGGAKSDGGAARSLSQGSSEKERPCSPPPGQLGRKDGDDVCVDSGQCLALGTCRDDSRVTVQKAARALGPQHAPARIHAQQTPAPPRGCHNQRSTHCPRGVAAALGTQTGDVHDNTHSPLCLRT